MDIDQIIIEVLLEYLRTQGMDHQVNTETMIFGENGILDSMGIVNLIVDLEACFSDKGVELDLTSEKALSLRNSPYRSVSTISEFIRSQL
jgi:acyl carrier protein